MCDFRLANTTKKYKKKNQNKLKKKIATKKYILKTINSGIVTFSALLAILVFFYKFVFVCGVLKIGTNKKKTQQTKRLCRLALRLLRSLSVSSIFRLFLFCLFDIAGLRFVFCELCLLCLLL